MADATIVNLVPPVVADAIAIKVLESNAARTLDALHVGCSLQWNAELFATLDERQLREAERANLRTKKVRTGQQRNRLDRRSVRSRSPRITRTRGSGLLECSLKCCQETEHSVARATS